MNMLRSLAFNLAWYANIVLQMVFYLPFVRFFPHKKIVRIIRRWTISNNFLQRVLAGTELELSGIENLPEGGCIIASKHQSIWEFYGLFTALKDPCFVLKEELMKIPVFGFFVAKTGHIPIRRSEKGLALRKMIADAKEAVGQGREIIIFVEGTRKEPGAAPDYRYGITRMYREIDCPIVPLALDSGLYWPRRKFRRHKGILRARFLPPIERGLTEKEFSKVLREQLYLQASGDAHGPPLSQAVRKAVARAQESAATRAERQKQFRK